MGGGVICCVLALNTIVLVDLVSSSGEMHSNEGGKFAEFRNQTDYAEIELRKDLALAAEDEVHLSNIALQIKDGHIYNVTFQVKRNLICSIVVHERDDDRPLEVLKAEGKISLCTEQAASTTEASIQGKSAGPGLELDSLTAKFNRR